VDLRAGSCPATCVFLNRSASHRRQLRISPSLFLFWAQQTSGCQRLQFSTRFCRHDDGTVPQGFPGTPVRGRHSFDPFSIYYEFAPFFMRHTSFHPRRGLVTARSPGVFFSLLFWLTIGVVTAFLHLKPSEIGSRDLSQLAPKARWAG